MAALEELPARAHRKWPFVADNASRVRYALFYAPPREPDVAERLALGELDALVRTPHSVSSALAAATLPQADSTETSLSRRKGAAEAWMRRVYSAPNSASRVVFGDVSETVVTAQLLRDGHTDVWAGFGHRSALSDLLSAATKQAVRSGSEVDLVIPLDAGESVSDLATSFIICWHHSTYRSRCSAYV